MSPGIQRFQMVADVLASNAGTCLQRLWPRPEWVNVVVMRPKEKLIKKQTSWI